MKYIVDKINFQIIAVYNDNEVIPEEISAGKLILDNKDFLGFANPYLDGNEIKDKTKLMLYKEGKYTLKNGEVFENNEFKIIPQPSEWHYWDFDKKQWLVDIERVKTATVEYFKGVRQSKIEDDIMLHGETFRVKEKDLENFRDIERAIARGAKKPADKLHWIVVEDKIVELTYGQVQEVLDERARRKEKIFAQYAKLMFRLKMCTTVDEIKELRWED